MKNITLKQEYAEGRVVDQGSGETHVELQNLEKLFGVNHAVNNLNLSIEKGGFTCLLGPSGCGKTTTLRMISGFIEPSGGNILISGKSQLGIPPHKRNTSIVFQEYALFPHMTTRQNIEYGLKVKKLDAKIIKKKTDDIIEFMGLGQAADRAPKFLSGGQQQRVALARSLVMEPEVLLMDEPLSNLDAKLRVRVRTEIKEIQKRLGITTIYVTHDQEEALSIADRIAVMNDGVLQQYGTPWNLYFNPANQFVADFIGINNFLDATVLSVTKKDIHIAIGGQKLTVKNDGFLVEPESTVTIGIRPESITVQRALEQKEHFVKGEIRIHQFLGSLVRYWIDFEGFEVMVDDHAPAGTGILPPGPVFMEFKTIGMQFFKK